MSIGVNRSSVNSDYWGNVISKVILFRIPPFHSIATSLDLAELDARPSPWDAPYSLAPDAGKSDLCGRVERDDCF